MMTPDQVVEAKHGLAGLAELMGTYVRHLQGCGFTRNEAIVVALGWQTEALKASRGPDVGDEDGEDT